MRPQAVGPEHVDRRVDLGDRELLVGGVRCLDDRRQAPVRVAEDATVPTGLVDLEREHRGRCPVRAVRLAEVAQQLGRDERRVAGQDEHVVGAPFESSAGASYRVPRPERLLLDGDLHVAECVGARRRRDDDHGLDTGIPGGRDDPVHHPAPEDRVKVLRHARMHPRAEACGHHDCCELLVVHSAVVGWGARIRTWDHGTKTRCLTTWPRPRELRVETECPASRASLPFRGNGRAGQRPSTVRVSHVRPCDCSSPAARAAVRSSSNSP